MHIKPLERAKLFTGKMVRDASDIARPGAVDDDEPVLAQEPVEFLSEWRAYVLRDQIVHVGRYRGNPLQFPDGVRLAEARAAFTNCPIAFNMDWGITPEGQTLFFEIDDGVALGNYGLNEMLHTAMIEAHWRQLKGHSDNGIGHRLYD